MSELCAVSHCKKPRPTRRRFRAAKDNGFRLDGAWFCGDECLSHGFEGALRALRSGRIRALPPERSLRPSIGLLLLEQGRVSRQQLTEALSIQQELDAGPIGRVLMEQGVVSEREVTQALSRQFAVPWVNVVSGEIAPEVVRLLPAAIVRTYRAVPVDYRRDDDRLLLAIVGPPDYAFLNGASRMLELDITILVADESRLAELIEHYYPERDVDGRVLQLNDVHDDTLAKTLAGMAAGYGADSMRLESCGARLWLRMFKGERQRDFLLEVSVPNDGEAYVS